MENHLDVSSWDSADVDTSGVVVSTRAISRLVSQKRKQSERLSGERRAAVNGA